MTFAYSPRKKKAKDKAEYSVWYPATSSDSLLSMFYALLAWGEARQGLEGRALSSGRFACYGFEPSCPDSCPFRVTVPIGLFRALGGVWSVADVYFTPKGEASISVFGFIAWTRSPLSIQVLAINFNLLVILFLLIIFVSFVIHCLAPLVVIIIMSRFIWKRELEGKGRGIWCFPLAYLFLN